MTKEPDSCFHRNDKTGINKKIKTIILNEKK